MIYYVDGLGEGHGEVTYVNMSDGLLSTASIYELEFYKDDGLEILEFLVWSELVVLTRQ